MKKSDFNYDLPGHLIAQHPSAERDGCRLLCLNGGTGALADCAFTDLPDFLEAGDCLVLNDTRVLPARLLGVKAGGTCTEASGTPGQVKVAVAGSTEAGAAAMGASRGPSAGTAQPVSATATATVAAPAAVRQRTPPCRGAKSVFFLAGPRIVNTAISFLVTFSCVFAEALRSTAPVVGRQDARQINKTLLPTGDQRGVPVNDTLTRPIGVLGSRHEFAPRYHGKNFLPSPRYPAHSNHGVACSVGAVVAHGGRACSMVWSSPGMGWSWHSQGRADWVRLIRLVRTSPRVRENSPTVRTR